MKSTYKAKQFFIGAFDGIRIILFPFYTKEKESYWYILGRTMGIIQGFFMAIFIASVLYNIGK